MFSQEEYVKNNVYVPPNVLSRTETLQELSRIYDELSKIKNTHTLSRGDRIYYDVNGIIQKAQDKLQIEIDNVYNKDD